jgi:DHA2 family methylenomycin A resistance protein-like MFS transporter
MLVFGCGLGLNTGPVNAVAVANVPAGRSGTASGLVNTARVIGATLGIAVLGAVFATFAGGVGEGSHIVAGLAPAYVGGGIGEGSHIVAGLAPAYVGGGIGEMIGAAAAFAFIRRDSLHPAAR